MCKIYKKDEKGQMFTGGILGGGSGTLSYFKVLTVPYIPYSIFQLKVPAYFIRFQPYATYARHMHHPIFSQTMRPLLHAIQ